MSGFLCISVHFLSPWPTYHGCCDAGETEWPPSPVRLFQALVASAVDPFDLSRVSESARLTLDWLTQLPAPSILSPAHIMGSGFRLSVPNNDLDGPAAMWWKGAEPVKPHRPIDLRTMKTVRPVHIRAITGNEATVHYLYPLPDACPDLDQHFTTLRTAARSITHLGWGIDMVAGNAEVLDEAGLADLKGERWEPSSSGSGTGLRVPVEGTLTALAERHERFLGRLSTDGFRPVPPLTKFKVVSYRRAFEPVSPQVAAFQLLQPDFSKPRAFDTVMKSRHVAGMLRCATQQAANLNGWSDERIACFVMGHGEARGEAHRPVGQARLAYLPLPSIERRGTRGNVVTAVRRALLTVWGGHGAEEIRWAQRTLSGAALIDKSSQSTTAILSNMPLNDWCVRQYVPRMGASDWATVTPVVLPGYDDPDHFRKRLNRRESTLDSTEQRRLLDKLDSRIDGLLRKAIRQAGYAEELAAHAQLEWRTVGYLAGVDIASRYEPPPHLKKLSRYHVKIRWCDASGNAVRVPGPVCLGGGRYVGLGLFAALDGEQSSETGSLPPSPPQST